MNKLLLLVLCMSLYSCSENKKETAIATSNQANITSSENASEADDTIKESISSITDSAQINFTIDSSKAKSTKESLQEFINKVSYVHGSPAMRIEDDIYRFYNGDTLKVEYYAKKRGYAILIGTYKFINDSTLLATWNEGYKDYNYKIGGELKTSKQESLVFKIDSKVEGQMQTITINNKTFFVQGYKEEL